LSTSASLSNLTPSWKQEVNRRVAAHKNRRGQSAAEREAPVEIRHGATSLAAQAAARVAARYAKAPSYSQLQAAEARTAIRAAEIATQVAIEAQATARAVLAGLDNGSSNGMEQSASFSSAVAAAPALIPEIEPPAQPFCVQQAEPPVQEPVVESRWVDEPLVRPVELEAAQHSQQPPQAEIAADPVEDWWQDARPESGPLAAKERERLESALPGLPVHANLIEFPRESLSTRRARPQLAELPVSQADDCEPQLSIFEVDPGTLALDAEAETVSAQPAASQWSGIELDAQPLNNEEPEAAAAPEAAAIELASFSRRLMAAVVDGALITGAFLVAAFLAASNMESLPSVRVLEALSASALFAIGLLYQVFFFTLADATPGMKYAHVSLCTFDDQSPTRAQLHGRLGALLLSVLPLGLGVAWAIFDENHLSWHDRLSRTYQRRCVR
jgi:uncharacterized RDD family membrane protein YckC